MWARSSTCYPAAAGVTPLSNAAACATKSSGSASRVHRQRRRADRRHGAARRTGEREDSVARTASFLFGTRSLRECVVHMLSHWDLSVSILVVPA